MTLLDDALISIDSSLKSDLTVGPPIDFVHYKKDKYKILSQKCLNISDDEYLKWNQWSDGIFKIFNSFPRFDWVKVIYLLDSQKLFDRSYTLIFFKCKK